MKTFYLLFLIAVCCSFTGQSFGQQPIKYGSNNGKYALIFNKKIYYEEYGNGPPLILLEGGMKI